MITIPEPLLLEKLGSHSILFLPWLDFKSGNQRILGEALALLHKSSTEHSPGKFGWETDGFIGSNTQLGGWNKSWGKCFVELRLSPQIEMAKKWKLYFDQEKFKTTDLSNYSAVIVSDYCKGFVDMF